MAKAWKRGSRHYVSKTRKEHKCLNCRFVIEKGSSAEYKNAFTGKRDYFHYFQKDCLNAEIKHLKARIAELEPACTDKETESNEPSEYKDLL